MMYAFILVGCFAKDNVLLLQRAEGIAMGPRKDSRTRRGKQSTSFRSREVETCPQQRPAHRRELCLH